MFWQRHVWLSGVRIDVVLHGFHNGARWFSGGWRGRSRWENGRGRAGGIKLRCHFFFLSIHDFSFLKTISVSSPFGLPPPGGSPQRVVCFHVIPSSTPLVVVPTPRTSLLRTVSVKVFQELKVRCYVQRDSFDKIWKWKNVIWRAR